MMMMTEDEFQDSNNLSLDDIDLSLLRLSSPPYSSQPSFFSDVTPEISPLKRSSPVSDESDQSKRRKISPQSPILITSPLRFTYPETQSSTIDDPTRYPNLAGGHARCSHASPVSEKTETTPFASKTPDAETMKMVSNRVEEVNHEETNYDAYEKPQQEDEQEEDCGEGMRIERSGDGFVIRLKCRCKLAFRVLFSDHHLYFKPL